MFKKRFAIISICIFVLGPVCAQDTELLELPFLKVHRNDSVLTIPKKPWLAVAETFGLNVGVWAFDRYALKGEYAYINLRTMRHNIRNGFVWDNDQFSTNLFAHPYHGGLYFNTARSNGMNFWQSIPYSVGGSLMWEMLMENEPPAINDFIATSVGGMCLGEVTFRLSDMIIDERSDGWERFGREFLGTLVSPMRGLNRIISGDAWKRRSIKGSSIGDVPARFYLTGGYRMLSDNTKLSEDISQAMFADLKLIYGDPFSKEDRKPYDYFSLALTANFFSDQPLISNVNAIGMLWGKNIGLKSKSGELTLGIFQHFDYYDSYAGIDNTYYHSYKISQAAAFGGGLLYKTHISNSCTFVYSAYLTGILLGGSLTDYYRAIDRDYNMGSGFSYKTRAGVMFDNKLEIGLNVEDYRIFTWKGYDPDQDLSQLTQEGQIYLNAQGDKGDAHLRVTSMNINYRFKKRYTLSLDFGVHERRSYYAYFPSVKYSVSESRLGFGYLF